MTDIRSFFTKRTQYCCSPTGKRGFWSACLQIIIENNTEKGHIIKCWCILDVIRFCNVQSQFGCLFYGNIIFWVLDDCSIKHPTFCMVVQPPGSLYRSAIVPHCHCLSLLICSITLHSFRILPPRSIITNLKRFWLNCTFQTLHSSSGLWLGSIVFCRQYIHTFFDNHLVNCSKEIHLCDELSKAEIGCAFSVEAHTQPTFINAIVYVMSIVAPPGVN